jgi:hypothetical protein
VALAGVISKLRNGALQELEYLVDREGRALPPA